MLQEYARPMQAEHILNNERSQGGAHDRCVLPPGGDAKTILQMGSSSVMYVKYLSPFFMPA